MNDWSRTTASMNGHCWTMLRRFWKYGLGGFAVYLVLAYSFFVYRHMFPLTHIAMTTPVDGLSRPQTPVAATSLSQGTGALSSPNARKTIQNKLTNQNNTTTQGSSIPTTSKHIFKTTRKPTRKSKEMSVLTPVFKGRLGNQLFEYAASYAVAKMKNMSLYIPEGNTINKLFHIDKTVVTSHGCSSWRSVFVDCCSYHPDLITKIHQHGCQKIGLYLQSWKYFKPVEASIRQQLTFRRNIALAASGKLLSLTQEFLNRQSGWLTDQGGHHGNWTTPTGGVMKNANVSLLQKHVHKSGAAEGDVTYIGVHVRRGDYMSTRSRRQGRITPPAEYYIHAMKYFRALFPNTLFVVAGDAGNWVNRNIGAPDVVLVQNETAEVDLCVLSMCNHTIISAGSFGWWAGFLAGGTTVYYKHPYRNNTEMSRWYHSFHSDYVLPDWVPMD